MSITLTYIAYCLAIVLASLAGGWLPMLIRMTHRRMQLATSLIAGFMLGIALLHLLPHALMDITVSRTVGWMLAGLLTMFFLERFLSYHHHTAPGDEGKPPVTADPEMIEQCQHEAGNPIDHTHGHPPTPPTPPTPPSPPTPPLPHAPSTASTVPTTFSPATSSVTHQHEHEHNLEHGHHEHTHDTHTHSPSHQLSWTGVAAGLVIHSLIGGLALGAAMMAQSQGIHSDTSAQNVDKNSLFVIPGLAVFLVIVLHKPFDSMTLLTLLRTTHWSRRLQHAVNALFALVVPIGCGLFLLGITNTAGNDYDQWVGSAVAFAAGVFLCVALADLLPEVHFHQHDRVKLSVAVMIGLALSWGIAVLESQSHGHEHASHAGHLNPTDHLNHTDADHITDSHPAHPMPNTESHDDHDHQDHHSDHHDDHHGGHDHNHNH